MSSSKVNYDADGEDVGATTFKLLVGSLIYMPNTKPDICYTVGIISRFMCKPKLSHYQTVVRNLRYVKGTLEHGIMFSSGVSYLRANIIFRLLLVW